MSVESHHKRTIIWAAGLLFLLSLGTASSNLNVAEFVWDDTYLVEQNPAMDSISSIPAYFARPWAWGTTSDIGAQKNLAYYRPLVMMSLTVDALIWGKSPVAFRVTNNLLHALITVTFFLLCLKSGASFWISVMVAALQAVHPIAGEVTSIAAYRTTLMACLFSLLALMNALKAGHTEARIPWGPLTATAAFTLLAMLCKESSVVLLVLVPLVYAISGTLNRGLLYAAGAAAVPIATVWCIKSAVTSSVPGAVTAYFSFSERIYLACKLFLHYLGTYVLPYPLSAAYDFSMIPPPSGPGDPMVLAGALTGMLLLGAALALIVKKRRQGFALLGFLVCLAPYLHLVPFRVVFAARFLYLPSLFLLLAGSLTLSGWRQSPAVARVCLGAGLCIVLVLGTLSVVRHREFCSNRSLLVAEVEHFPGSFNAHFAYAGYLDRRDMTKDALEEVERALEIWPGFEPAVRLRDKLQKRSPTEEP